jgi:hypothetical protein
LFDPVNHLVVAPPDQFANFLLQQRKDMLALLDEQIDQDAPPLFALPLKPLLDLMLNLLCDPLIEPCDEIHGGILAFLDFNDAQTQKA